MSAIVATFCGCGARVERLHDLDGIAIMLQRAPRGEYTLGARVDGTLRVSLYDPSEDDGTDRRYTRHLHGGAVS